MKKNYWNKQLEGIGEETNQEKESEGLSVTTRILKPFPSITFVWQAECMQLKLLALVYPCYLSLDYERSKLLTLTLTVYYVALLPPLEGSIGGVSRVDCSSGRECKV